MLLDELIHYRLEALSNQAHYDLSLLAAQLVYYAKLLKYHG